MSSDQFGLAVGRVRRDAESCVLTLAGELSFRSAGTVCGAVTKALLEVDRVLVDVSRLRLTWTPAVQVFPHVCILNGAVVGTLSGGQHTVKRRHPAQAPNRHPTRLNALSAAISAIAASSRSRRATAASSE